MSTNSKHINGNLIFLDGANKQRWLGGFGPNLVGFSEHFINTPFASADNLAACTTTLVEGGAGDTTVALVAGAQGGNLLITTDDAENDGANIQWQGEAFKAANSYPLYFRCTFKISEATQSDFLLGLCITDTDLLGGMTDGIYFRKADGSTTMSFVLEKNSTETATAYGTAIAADTWYTVEFVFDGTNVDWYVNGTIQTRPATTNLCDDEFLTPSVHYLTGAAAAITMSVDEIAAYQIQA